MLNYYKSERYRIRHIKSLYLFAAFLCIIIVVVNAIIAKASLQAAGGAGQLNTAAGFRAVTNRMTMVMMLIMAAVYLIFGEEYWKKTFKNTLSFGISRSQLLLGRFLAVAEAVTVIYFSLMLFYCLVSTLLLPQAGIGEYTDFWKAVFAFYPCMLGCAALELMFLFVIPNGVLASLLWFAAIGYVPMLFAKLSESIPAFERVYRWFYWVQAGGYSVNGERAVFPLETGEAVIRLLLSGIFGAVLFTVIGMVLFRKKEIH